uniref:Lipocalin n=1 Tax=Rhipicephalus appendiculatus TaxID=34631 RepID=A0A131YR54_RHIAP
MVFLSLLVICFFCKSLAFQTKTSTGDKKQTGYLPELKPNLTVLVEAINTNERIWLKMLTYIKEHVTCLYFEKLELKNYTYNYTYIYNERYRKIHQSESGATRTEVLGSLRKVRNFHVTSWLRAARLGITC